jgi:hypothetical protein
MSCKKKLFLQKCVRKQTFSYKILLKGKSRASTRHLHVCVILEEKKCSTAIRIEEAVFVLPIFKGWLICVETRLDYGLHRLPLCIR